MNMKKAMMVRAVSILSVLLSVAVLVSVLFLREESTGILYRVSGGKQDMYLLGSIHVGSRDMYPFGDAIQTAMQDADVLVFECDTQSAAAVEETSQLMRYAEGDALHNHVSEACMADVRKVAKKLGYDVNEMENLKPWAVTSLLSMDTLSAEMGTQDVPDAVALGVETAVRK